MVCFIDVLEKLGQAIAKAHRLPRRLSGPYETSHRRLVITFIAESRLQLVNSCHCRLGEFGISTDSRQIFRGYPTGGTITGDALPTGYQFVDTRQRLHRGAQ
jgi:hypothetical protein